MIISTFASCKYKKLSNRTSVCCKHEDPARVGHCDKKVPHWTMISYLCLLSHKEWDILSQKYCREAWSLTCVCYPTKKWDILSQKYCREAWSLTCVWFPTGSGTFWAKSTAGKDEHLLAFYFWQGVGHSEPKVLQGSMISYLCLLSHKEWDILSQK